MRPRASSAMCGLIAATAATACPLYSTFSLAKQLLLMNRGLIIAPSPRSVTLPEGWGSSAAVSTALTPGRAEARLASMDLMRACAWGLRRILPYSSPVSRMSAPYWARPVTLSAPSGRMGRVPITVYSLEEISGMAMISAYIGSLRSFVDNIWSVVCPAWHEAWRLVAARGALRAFSACIPAAQAYIGKLIFDTLSAGYASGDRHVWQTAIGYLLLEVLLLAA